MKKIILIFAIIQVMSFSLIAQTSTEEIEKLKQVNQETVAKYKAGKFNDALKSAQTALDLTIKIFGAEHLETATSYTNLGAIYRADKKYKEAAENFQKALAIYQQNQAQNAGRIAKTSESLGITLALDGKKKQGEEFLLQSVTSAENAFGKESKKILPYLKSLSDFYIYVKKSDEAQQVFARRYLMTSKYFQPESKELEGIEDDFYCFRTQNYNLSKIDERKKKFYEATRSAKSEEIQSAKSETPGKTINGGVINGRAENLAKPEYPVSARVRFIHGTIPVRVKIDEKGQVISAKALCGNPDLRTASEEAAKKSKFTPTILDGKPVKVTGIVIYNFVI